MQNERGFAVHSLSTGEGEWTDLGGTPQARAHGEPQIERWDLYDGPLSHLDEEPARELLVELLTYFRLEGFPGVPLPPKGLPGTRSRHAWGDPGHRLLALGWDYLLAAARGQSRTMHNRWESALDMLRNERGAGRQEVQDAEYQKMRERWADAERRKTTNAQLVYFIASESGPIKIGIAANPQARCKELQTSHHERLTILVTCPGGQPLEAQYHKRFATHRRAGEWFNRAPEILAEIDRLNGGAA